MFCCMKRSERESQQNEPAPSRPTMSHRRVSLADTIPGGQMSVLQELSNETYMEYDYDAPLSTLNGVSVTNFFVIGDIIGRGQSTFVFDATFIPTQEKVAIKFYNNYLNCKKAILRELQVLRISDRCKQLLRYHSHFRVNTRCYIIAELVSKNFHEFLDPNLNLPPTLVRIYLKQIAKGLMYLHENGFIHRDLTLKNLALDFSGNLRIIDYGMARTVVDPMGITFTDWGTLKYAAPEVYKDKLCSFPVDWWCLGIISYRFVTGGFPYPTNNRRVYSYTVIQNHVVVYPQEFFLEEHIMSLTQGLMCRSASKRIGSKDDKEIMKHPYFQHVNWESQDDVMQAIFNSDQKELLWFKDAYNNILPMLGHVLTDSPHSEMFTRFSRLETMLAAHRGYRPNSFSV